MHIRPAGLLALAMVATLMTSPSLTSAQSVTRNPSSIANQSAPQVPADTATEPAPADRALALLQADEQPIDERIAEVARIVAANQEDAVAWAVLGELRLEAGESDTALLAFERAVAKDPTLASSWHWIGMLKKRKGDMEGALKAFQSALSNGAPRSQQMNEIAVALAQMGRTDEALKNWDTAITEDPQWGVLYTNAMKGALQKGDEKLARSYFDRGLKAERFEEVMVLMWGDHLVRQGREREALDIYAAGLAVRPDSPRILYAQGMTLKERRQSQEAVASLEKSRNAAQTQNDPATREAAAKALFSLQHPAAHKQLMTATEKVNTPWSSEQKLVAEMRSARELLDAVISQHPDLWEPYLLRGTALRRLSEVEAARADFDKVLSLVPEQPNALVNLAILSQEDEQLEAAVDLATRAVAASGGDWTISLTAGFVYLEAGNCEKAREMIRETRRRLPRGYPEDPTLVLADEIDAICG